MIRFEITDIDDNEWQALDFLLEQVEKGETSEDILLNHEIFLHMLSAVKFDVNNYMKIPHFIRRSKLSEKYYEQVNPNIIEILNNNLSETDIYKKYLGL